VILGKTLFTFHLSLLSKKDLSMPISPCVLDVDTGEDDALALLLAVAYQLPLRAIVTSYGNTTLAHATANTAAILQLAGATHIPIVQGSETSLVPHPHPGAHLGAGDFVGSNGLCDVILPIATDVKIKTPHYNQLADVLCALLDDSTERIRYVVTGPCTNLAHIVRQLGDHASAVIEEIVLMATALTVPGNSGPIDADGNQAAEFNCYCDAEAFAVVLASGIPVTVVSWDVTSTTTIPYSAVCGFVATTPTSMFVVQLMRAFLERYGLAHAREFELNDPLTIWAMQGYGRYRMVPVQIVTDSIGYGATHIDTKGVLVRYLEPFTDVERMIAIREILQQLGISSYSIR
jgi:purine nucleosidase